MDAAPLSLLYEERLERRKSGLLQLYGAPLRNELANLRTFGRKCRCLPKNAYHYKTLNKSRGHGSSTYISPFNLARAGSQVQFITRFCYSFWHRGYCGVETYRALTRYFLRFLISHSCGITGITQLPKTLLRCNPEP